MTEQSDSVGRCTTCGAPIVDDKPMADAKRLLAPYHEAVSWTYYNKGGRADEALLRIRKALKTAVGWWSAQDQADFDAMEATRK